MIQLVISSLSSRFIVTLAEYTTIEDGYYLFVFKNQATKEEVKVIYSFLDDLSGYDRYNEFEINPSVIFANALPGWWLYNVYQQESGSNLDPDLSDGLVETGKMFLSPSSEFTFQMYDETTSYIVYNG